MMDVKFTTNSMPYNYYPDYPGNASFDLNNLGEWIPFLVRIFVETLCIVLAYKLARPVMTQIFKGNSDPVVGAIDDDLPCDHAGFPYLNTAKITYLLFAFSMFLWIVMVEQSGSSHSIYWGSL